MDQRRIRPGDAQRRQRQRMRRHGWASITTFIRVEHKACLKEVQQRYSLQSLHEALDHVLATAIHHSGIATTVRARDQNGTPADTGSNERAASGVSFPGDRP